MPRHINLHPHLTTDELEGRYRRAKEAHERSWWQILWLLSRGQTAKQIADSTSYSPYWIGQIARRYNEHGPGGMHNRQRTASWRPARMLSMELQEELRQALAGSGPGHSKRWTARMVAAWMSRKLGRPVRVQRGWDYLQRLKHSPQLPRPYHALANLDEQTAFKNRQGNSHVPLVV
jgi:transposase